MEKGYIVKKALSGDKKFNIVIPTYEHKYKLDVIINCFLAQTFEDWVMTIVCDGEPDEVYNNIREQIKSDVDTLFGCKRHEQDGVKGS
jgi:glycosyltransferase involved in cell wall biosynthesis